MYPVPNMAEVELMALKNWLKEVAYLRIQIYEAERELEQIHLQLAQFRGRVCPPFVSQIRTDSAHTTYKIDIQRVMKGEDLRTTLMIKNIPDMLKSEMLLVEINKHIRPGTYDFLYLPLYLKASMNLSHDKTNYGYAFINMIRSIHVAQLYKALHGKNWGLFPSRKAAALKYAKVQGKDALIEHFKYTKIKNQEKCFHPILFTNTGDQEPFPFRRD
ncbi:hypothetical protein LXL04_009412 [Taraxacum kok-saghyz]